MERIELKQARKRKHLTQELAAGLIGVAARTYRQWERGTAMPHPSNTQRLCEVLGASLEDLGLAEPEKKARIPGCAAPLFVTFLQADLSMRLLTIPRGDIYEVQVKTKTTLEEFDAMNINPVTRREALKRIIAIALAPAALTASAPRADDVLHQCAVSITACHDLGRGKDIADLPLAFQGVTAVLEKLKPLLQDSRYRKTAATLAAQAARLQNVLASHLEGAAAAIPFAQQAVLYSKEAGNVPEQLMALIGLAWAYESVPRYNKAALLTMEQAAALAQEQKALVPLYISGTIQSTLAVMQSKNGVQSNESLRNAAKLVFADQSYTLFVDDSIYTLTINGAESLYHGGQPDLALTSLSQLIDIESKDPHGDLLLTPKRSTMSERGYIRTLSDLMQASLRTKNKDLEFCIALWKGTMRRVQSLKSERRFEEAMFAYQVMDTLWGSDRRVKELLPLTSHW